MSVAQRADDICSEIIRAFCGFRGQCPIAHKDACTCFLRWYEHRADDHITESVIYCVHDFWKQYGKRRRCGPEYFFDKRSPLYRVNNHFEIFRSIICRPPVARKFTDDVSDLQTGL